MQGQRMLGERERGREKGGSYSVSGKTQPEATIVRGTDKRKIN